MNRLIVGGFFSFKNFMEAFFALGVVVDVDSVGVNLASLVTSFI